MTAAKDPAFESPSAPAAPLAPALAGPPSRLGTWLRLVFGLLLLGAMCVFAVAYMRREPQAWQRLRDAEPFTLAGATLALAGVMVVNGLSLRDLVARTGVTLRASTWLGLTFVGSMLNLVSPVSGAGALRGVYLKRVHGVSYSVSLQVMAASFLLNVATTGSLASAGLLVLGVPGGRAGWLALAGSVGLTLAVVGLMAAVPRLPGRLGRWGKLERFLASWAAFRGDPRLVGRLWLWSGGSSLLHALGFALSFRIAGFDGDVALPIVSSAFARTAALFAITPAGLGIYEAFGIVSAQLLGAQAGPAVLGVLLVRVLSSLVAIVGGLLFAPLLLRLRRLAR